MNISDELLRSAGSKDPIAWYWSYGKDETLMYFCHLYETMGVFHREDENTARTALCLAAAIAKSEGK